MTCRMCGKQDGHWSGCPLVLHQAGRHGNTPAQPRVVTPKYSQDDADWAALHTVTLPYCEHSRRVLRGPHRGQDVGQAEGDATALLLTQFRMVTVQRVVVRPWWRWWQPTSARQLTPQLPRREVRP